MNKDKARALSRWATGAISILLFVILTLTVPEVGYALWGVLLLVGLVWWAVWAWCTDD